MSPVLESPVIVLGKRDAEWLAQVLEHLVGSGYFRNFPHLGERASSLVADCHAIVNHCQTPEGRRHVAEDELVSYKAAAELLGISERTLYRRVNDGALAPVRLGGTVRFRRTDLASYLEEA